MVERLVFDLYDDREWGVLASALDMYASNMAAQAESELAEEAPNMGDASLWNLEAKIARELFDNLNAGKYAAEAEIA